MDNLTAHQEDVLTLRNILGMNEEFAEGILAQTILVTLDESDETVLTLFNFLVEILSRTVSNISNVLTEAPDIEIIINNSIPKTDAQRIFVVIDDDKIKASEEHLVCTEKVTKPHKSLILLGAAYISAYTLRHIIGDNPKLPAIQNNIVLDFKSIFPDLTFFNKEVDFKKTYLAGGGAIGNAFLYALKEFDIKGELVIVDPDYVSQGNLNRCILFNDSMLKKNKAEVLMDTVQPYFTKLKLIAHPGFLNTIPERGLDGKWLKRLVVAVDSRRARRSLQTEIPQEVFDASTTNIEEVVLHFHKRPLNGSACLECIYPHDDIEDAHEQHIAEVLGISKSDVRGLNITEDAALKIIAKYPSLNKEQLLGLSYDTLFKELCGQGKLQIESEKHIFAPFAFVSVLAGAILAIETVRRIVTNNNDFSFWKLSPWIMPIPRLKQNWSKNKLCTFCNDKIKSEFADKLWS